MQLRCKLMLSPSAAHGLIRRWRRSTSTVSCRPFGPFGGAAHDTPPRKSHAAVPAQQEDTDALQLYLFGVEAGQLHEVAQRLAVTSQVAPTQRLQGADAVLAARAKVSQVRDVPWCMRARLHLPSVLWVTSIVLRADADCDACFHDPSLICPSRWSWPSQLSRMQLQPLTVARAEDLPWCSRRAAGSGRPPAMPECPFSWCGNVVYQMQQYVRKWSAHAVQN